MNKINESKCMVKQWKLIRSFQSRVTKLRTDIWIEIPFVPYALRNIVACVQSRIHPTADFGRQSTSISLAISSFIYLFWSVPQCVCMCVCVCVCVCVRFSLFQSMDLFLTPFFPLQFFPFPVILSPSFLLSSLFHKLLSLSRIVYFFRQCR